MLRSQSIQDGSGGWRTESFGTPTEQAIESDATRFMGDIVKQLPGVFNGDPAQTEKTLSAYRDPQLRALNESYDDAYKRTNHAGVTSGMKSSVGYQDYMAKALERERARGVADIESNAEMMRYQLPSMALAPYGDIMNMFSAAMGGEQARQMSTVNPVMQGAQMSNNFALNNYQNQLASYNANQQQSRNNGGFFSRLFGGF